jgi:hypothetical protein
MAKPSKEHVITEIMILMESGITYSECFAQLCTKLQLKERTFATRWKEAGIKHSDKQQVIQNEITAHSKYAAINRLESSILSKEQALQILSDLAMTAERDSDKVNALKTMADFEGWKAPIKSDLTTNGKEIQGTIIKWGDSEISV